ncbi:MAG: sigma-54-dependent Fis family transcriptional regulator [Calditrichaceae bacterium]|nr:sigma-54 dependent transcriptional regulator [Calditrichia bacterium]NUQ43579.1 sigma-54-dependent Fis family transcriptional regulator [Calditrichaceae bacterium]
MPLPKLLAVDDEQSSLNAIFRTLRREFEVFLALNGRAALEILKGQEMAVILADQRMPEMSGVEFFNRAQKLQPQAIRILITGYTDSEAIIQAINEGRVYYYITKPWEPEELRLVMRRAAEQHHLVQENRRLLRELEIANQRLQQENILLHREVEKQYLFDNIIGQSAAMEEVFRLVRKVIPTDTTVLLLGETGTGKELIARAIHFNGPRKERMFVAQNCGALPDTLLESELFGHVKGAFTGAASDKKGLFELADGGTIFLDEITDTSPAMQQRLLRALQEGEIHPLGAERTIKVDVRVISAANRDVQQAIREGKFREDLFYRLNVFPIRIPPLRERREDIPRLAEFFLEKYARKLGKAKAELSPEAISRLLVADFPGNVRELENLIERAVTLADEQGQISAEILQLEAPRLHSPNSQRIFDAESASGSLKEMVDSLEKLYITRALEEFRGNVSRAAQKLGLSRLGLHKKMHRYGIDPDSFRS